MTEMSAIAAPVSVAVTAAAMAMPWVMLSSEVLWTSPLLTARCSRRRGLGHRGCCAPARCCTRGSRSPRCSAPGPAAREGRAGGGIVTVRRVGPRGAVLQRPGGPPAASLSASLKSLYKMTPAESGLTQALIGGHTLAEYARSRGVSMNTARTQMKSAAARTGARCQVDLVRMVLTGPAMMQRPMATDIGQP